jgi:hypothetical protein
MFILQKTKREKLRELIGRNYLDFRNKIRLSSPDSIYDMASHIVAVEEVYYQLMNHRWVETEDDAEYLMTFSNPLRYVAYIVRALNAEGQTNFSNALQLILHDHEHGWLDYYFEDNCGGGE